MESVWSDSCKFDRRDNLLRDIECDVLIIGAGIAGILTGYFLQESGKNVIIIEKNRIACGNTKKTTAKITSQHDLIYEKLIKEFGIEKAGQYARANELAIKKYKQIIEDKKIDCDFEELPAYLYSLKETDNLKREVESAKSLGIDAEFVETVKLPFKIKGAVKFNNQAQFNPLKFLKEIAKELKIYEDTKALEIKENLVVTNRGDIKARDIVVATHYPIMNATGYYFMKMHQERSYVIAIEDAEDVEGVYIDEEKGGYSFRNYNGLLLLGGESHRTGENEEGGSYEKLRKAAKEFYPNGKEKYHWSAQDCMTLDGIPYIGRYSNSTDNIYVATGFNKWGMTSSMVSAMIISDLILEKENDFSQIFSPHRFDLSLSINNIANDLIETSKNFIAEKIYIPESKIDQIEKGHGGIVEYNNEKVGVYKDNEGKVFIVSTKCTHLGCQLHWNADELTWDCPCHGSRFDYKGRVIDTPAIKNLENEE